MTDKITTWDCWNQGLWGTAFITTTNRYYFGLGSIDFLEFTELWETLQKPRPKKGSG